MPFSSGVTTSSSWTAFTNFPLEMMKIAQTLIQNLYRWHYREALERESSGYVAIDSE
jgi:hypothetical protein